MEGSCTEEDPLRRFGLYVSGGGAPPGGPPHHSYFNLNASTHGIRANVHAHCAIPLAECLPASVDSLSILRQALTRELL